MVASLHLLPAGLSELFAQTTLTGQITLADRYGLLAALLAESLSQEDKEAVDRLLYAVRRGKVSLSNDLSVVL